MVDTIIIHNQFAALMSFATILGMTVIILVAVCLIIGCLWGMTWLLGIALLHTSSSQLLAMVVVGYGTGKIAKKRWLL